MELFFAFWTGDHDLSAAAWHAERCAASATEIAVGFAILPFVFLKLKKFGRFFEDPLIAGKLLLSCVDIPREHTES